MPNMEELLNQKSTENVNEQNKPLWMSKINLEYAYDQLKLYKQTSRQCNFAITGGNMNGYYRSKKGFYGLSDMLTIFQKKLTEH